MPPLKGKAGWQALVTELLENAEAFANTVVQLPDSALDSPFVNEKYGSYYRNLEGVIEHSYYHLGQIVLIRKMITDTAG